MGIHNTNTTIVRWQWPLKIIFLRILKRGLIQFCRVKISSNLTMVTMARPRTQTTARPHPDPPPASPTLISAPPRTQPTQGQCSYLTTSQHLHTHHRLGLQDLRTSHPYWRSWGSTLTISYRRH